MDLKGLHVLSLLHVSERTKFNSSEKITGVVLGTGEALFKLNRITNIFSPFSFSQDVTLCVRMCFISNVYPHRSKGK